MRLTIHSEATYLMAGGTAAALGRRALDGQTSRERRSPATSMESCPECSFSLPFWDLNRQGSERVDGTTSIGVVIADGQSLFREAVRVVLEAEPDLRIVGEARDGLGAVAEVERTRPDVVLLDAHLPNCDGIRATQLISERSPETRVLVLSSEEDLSVLAEALEAGASGYLTKTSPLSELIDATRAIHRGDAMVPARMLGPLLARLIRRGREQDEATRRLMRLTKREREILSLLSEGLENEGIAQALVISPETARTHIQNVLGKLGVHSRLEAAAFARRVGASSSRTP